MIQGPRRKPIRWKRAAFELLWALLLPLRAYLRLSPLKRGKGRLIEICIKPILPPHPESFTKRLPDGSVIQLHHSGSIGVTVLAFGSFEAAEMDWLRSHAPHGSTAIDVGANVGVLTVQLARVVGDEGLVIACEPVPDNVTLLRRNLEINGLHNVRVFPLAVGARNELVRLHLGTDAAAHSTIEVLSTWRTRKSMVVRQVTLDELWHGGERPLVSLVKIDVEGAELGVLQGASEMLATTQPFLLIETRQPVEASLTAWLGERGYTQAQPPGFEPWNYAYMPARRA